MWSKRDILLFLAGAEAFHTLCHIFFKFSGLLPMRFFFITLTPWMNVTAIIVNAIITFCLIMLADRFS